MRRAGLGVVVEERALGTQARRFLQGAIDALIAQRRHARRVRRGIDERDDERALLTDRADLTVETTANLLPKGDRTRHEPVILVFQFG
jgi:hypothetical protein